MHMRDKGSSKGRGRKEVSPDETPGSGPEWKRLPGKTCPDDCEREDRGQPEEKAKKITVPGEIPTAFPL